MARYRFGLIMAILILVLAGCGPSGNNQGNNDQQVEGTPGSDPGTAPTNSLPEVVQPSGTGTPFAPGGLLPATPGVFAPGEGSPGQSASEGSFQTAGAIQASKLVNFRLAGPNGEIGNVEGLLFDPLSGQLLYLMIDTVGPNPNRELLVPWGAFQVVTLPGNVDASATAPSIYLTEAAGDLSDAPVVEFAQVEDPESLSPGWDAEAREYWAMKITGLPVTGTQPESGAAPILVNADGPRDLSIRLQGNQDQDLGTIKDFILSSEGKVSFALVETGLISGLGNDLVPVPFDRLAWQVQDRAFQMDASAEMLENAPRFDPDAVPQLAAPGWDAEWVQYWQGTSP